MSEKGTGLEKAVAKLDRAFASLPPKRRQALGLAIYRCYPAMKQYLTDVDQLFEGKDFSDALWSLIVAAVWLVPKGKDALVEKFAAAFATRAPVLGRFISNVTAACNRPPVALVEAQENQDADGEARPKVLPAAAP